MAVPFLISHNYRQIKYTYILKKQIKHHRNARVGFLEQTSHKLVCISNKGWQNNRAADAFNKSHNEVIIANI